MIPVFNPPRSKKRRRHHGGGIARACRKHGLKGRWRRSIKRGKYKRVYKKLMRLRKHTHKRIRAHRRKRMGLAAQFGAALRSLGGAAFGSKSYRRHSKTVNRISRRIRSGKKRAATKAERDANRRRREEAESAYADRELSFMNPGRRRYMRHRYNSPSAAAGITAGFRPANVTGVLPIIGGAIANGILRGMVSRKIPMLSSGLPSYAAGIATAGLVGAIGGMVNPGIGQSMFLGGMVETLSDAFVNVKAHGLSLKGLADFAMPRQIAEAAQFGAQMDQYPFPVTPAQVAPAMPAPNAEHAAVSNALHDFDLTEF